MRETVSEEIIRLVKEETVRQRKILEELGVACAEVAHCAKYPRPQIWDWHKSMQENLAKIYGLCTQTNLIVTERTEDGHLFRWQPKIGAWQTTSGQVVLVYPPNETSIEWKTSVPGTRHGGNSYVGELAEERAFCVAASYAKQKI